MDLDEIDPEEFLVEMTYRWQDVEHDVALDNEPWLPPDFGIPTFLPPEEQAAGVVPAAVIAPALPRAFRVDAALVYNRMGDESFAFVLFYDVRDAEQRRAADVVRQHQDYLNSVVNKRIIGAFVGVATRLVRGAAPLEGPVCGREGQPPPEKHVDVESVPTVKPGSKVPLQHVDGYWLTPIEVPFYSALKDTKLAFAVQP